MTKFSTLPTWTNVAQFTAALIRTGWQSPDTYTRAYSPVPTWPGIYMILAHDIDCSAVRAAFIAYIGMSSILSQRIDSSHEIWQQIARDGYSPQRWFHKTTIAELRVVERALIERYDPPYNIVGRKRGVH